MKNYFLASALLLASCGTSTEEVKTTETTPPAAPAAAVEAAPAGKELDLNQYGMPLTMRVPEGTTAEKKGDAVALMGPKLAIRITPYKGGEAEALKNVKEGKGNVAEMGLTTVTVDEPLVLRASQPGHSGMDVWVVNVPAANGFYYSVDMKNETMDTTKYSTADRDAMLAVARTIKPTKK